MKRETTGVGPGVTRQLEGSLRGGGRRSQPVAGCLKAPVHGVRPPAAHAQPKIAFYGVLQLKIKRSWLG
jgi:hypothetical protein